MSRTSVYRYFDKDGALLYVGITGSGIARMHRHASGSRWWSLVKTSTVVHYPTRAKALEVEAAAITAEHPIYNIVGKTRLYRRPADVLALIDAEPPNRRALPEDRVASMLGVPRSRMPDLYARGLRRKRVTSRTSLIRLVHLRDFVQWDLTAW